MFDGMTLPVRDLSLAGLVSLCVLLIIFGFLIPRWIHLQRIRDKEQQISYLQATVDKREEQFTTLLKNGELVIRLLEDLKREAAKRE